MSTTAWVAIGSITLDSTAPSVTFSSIPASYRDLVVVHAVDDGALGLGLRFNGDTGTNYTEVGAGSRPTATTSGTGTRNYLRLEFLSEHPTGQVGSSISHIMDYSATDKHKTVLNRNNGYEAGGIALAMTAGRWADTSAITSVTVVSTGGNLGVGSTFTLYGSNRL